MPLTPEEIAFLGPTVAEYTDVRTGPAWTVLNERKIGYRSVIWLMEAFNFNDPPRLVTTQASDGSVTEVLQFGRPSETPPNCPWPDNEAASKRNTEIEPEVLRRMAQDDRQYWDYLPPDRDRWLGEAQEKRRQKGEIPDFTPAQLVAIRARRMPLSLKGSSPWEFQDINSGMVERWKVWSFLIEADDWVDARKVAIDRAYPPLAIQFKKAEVRNEDPNRHEVHLGNVEKGKALKQAWDEWLATYDRTHTPPRWATWDAQ